MKSKINAARIISSVKKEDRTKGAVSIYVDKALFKKFQASCERNKISSNRVLEELIRCFIDSL